MEEQYFIICSKDDMSSRPDPFVRLLGESNVRSIIKNRLAVENFYLKPEDFTILKGEVLKVKVHQVIQGISLESEDNE